MKQYGYKNKKVETYKTELLSWQKGEKINAARRLKRNAKKTERQAAAADIAMQLNDYAPQRKKRMSPTRAQQKRKSEARAKANYLSILAMMLT